METKQNNTKWKNINTPLPKYTKSKQPKKNTLNILSTDVSDISTPPLSIHTIPKPSNTDDTLLSNPIQTTNENIIENFYDTNPESKPDERFNSENSPSNSQAAQTQAAWKDWFNNIKEKWIIYIQHLDISNVLEQINSKIVYWFILLFKFTQEEFELVKQNYENFILLFISFFVTYNLFYIMFVKEFEIIKLNQETLSNINYYLNYFLRSYFAPTVFFQDLFIYNIPFLLTSSFIQFEKSEILPKQSGGKICFILVFLISIFFVLKCLKPLYQSFMRAINFNTDNSDTLSGLIIAYIVIYLLYVTIVDQIPTLSDGLSIPVKIANMFSPIHVIFVFFTLLLLMIIVTMTSYFAIAFFCIFIFFIAFCPIIYFKFGNILKTIHDIHNFSLHGDETTDNSKKLFDNPYEKKIEE